MTTKDYTETLVAQTYDRICEIFSNQDIIAHVLDKHQKNKRSALFQSYYITVTGTSNFLDTPNTVGSFKAHYSLSGADENFLIRLSDNKKEALIPLYHLYLNI